MPLPRFALLLPLACWAASAATTHAQSAAPAPRDAAPPARPTPLATVRELADALEAGDTARLAATFHPAATITTVHGVGDEIRVATATATEVVAHVGSLGAHAARERFGRADVRVDGDLATVWTPYRFYAAGAFSHCGANAFTLVREPATARWRILAVTYTRRERPCPPLDDSLELAGLDALVDDWHEAAAVADSATFFGTLSPDGVYLGTDASERWLRDEMAAWAAPFFRRDTAWAFTPRERHWSLSEDGGTAWFDEHLDSWMGTVRGSGVLTRDGSADGPWLLRHYNLALAVPNERMDAVRLAIDPAAAPR